MAPRTSILGMAALLAAAAPQATAAQEAPPAALTFRFTMGNKALGRHLYQLAVWVAAPDGTFLDTVYVTGKTAKEGLGNNHSRILGLFPVRWPEALPVWAFARGVRYGRSFYPPRSQPLPDAVTSATPKAPSFERTLTLTPELLRKLKGTGLVCVAEVNVEGDGAPSMVFRGTLDLAKGGETLLTFVGTGHPKGLSGRISQGLDPRYKPADYIARASVSVGAN